MCGRNNTLNSLKRATNFLSVKNADDPTLYLIPVKEWKENWIIEYFSLLTAVLLIWLFNNATTYCIHLFPAVLSSGALCLQRLKIQIQMWVWSRFNKLFQKFHFVFLVHFKVVTVIWYTASEAVNSLCKVVYFLTRFINLLTCYFQLVDDNNR